MLDDDRGQRSAADAVPRQDDHVTVPPAVPLLRARLSHGLCVHALSTFPSLPLALDVGHLLFTCNF